MKSVSGNLDSTDVDGVNDSWQAQTIASANSYGSLQINANGTWTYTLDNSNATVNALNDASAPLTDTFTVHTADGTAHDVVITINGHTDVTAVTIPPVYTLGGDINDNDDVGPAAGATVTNSTSSGTEFWNGTNGNDTINAGNGTDTVYGHDGNDNINGENGADVSLYGQRGNDTLTGGSGSDDIYGGSGDDVIYGNAPPVSDETGDTGDNLYGGSGADTIHGQGGNDLIVGGFGADLLSGGGGTDTFKYIDLRDTGDTIQGFGTGDKIDFSSIDANGATAGDPAFSWGGTTATANGAWYAVSGANVVVYIDTDGNVGTAELAITLLGVSSLSATDFNL